MPSSRGLPHIPEILRVICEHLYSEKGSLASLARTCRMFEEPALDTLWFELDGFYKLAKCLPEITWKEEERNDENYYVVLKQPLSAADCMRFMYYARKVKNFSAISENGKKRVHSSLYEGLRFALPLHYVLPNIRKLTWHADKFHFIDMFLGPHLTAVEYKFSPKLSSQLSFLTALSERYPALRNVNISFHSGASKSHRQRASDFLSGVLYKWEDLQVLTVPVITYTALKALRGLPRLNTLEIEECNLDDHIATTVSEEGFPVLRQLKVTSCKSTEEAIGILSLLDHSTLLSLQMDFIPILSFADWKQIFLAINQHCRHESLASIVLSDGLILNFNEIVSSSTTSQMINCDVLKPLLVFHRLLFVLIEVAMGFHFSDRILIADMAQSWTFARDLQLRQRYLCRAAPLSAITLTDLTPFAEHCPDLKYIAIQCLDASSPPEIDSANIPGDAIRQTSLRRLFVGNSPIKNAGVVAANLSAIFPALESIETSIDQDPRNTEGSNSHHHNLWKQAEELVKLFAAVRNQGRLYERQYGETSDEDSEDEDNQMSV